MRLAALGDRLALLTDTGAVDVHDASDGRFAADPQAVWERWDEFRTWAADATLPAGVRVRADQLGPPVPRPRQIFAIGLNYDAHVSETGFRRPDQPVVFTKFASALTGPVGPVDLPHGGDTDWEIELVAIVGRLAREVPEADGWTYVGGLTAGQDLSERRLQMAGPAPQFSFGKSYPAFAPIGPCVVTPDEFADPDDLALECRVDGETVQAGRTRDMIFPVAALVSALSQVVTLFPGDLIFTGTPDGTGIGRTPPRYLEPGQVLRSSIEGIGELVQSCR